MGADHILPLWLAPRELRYWSADNLQTLCQPCHNAKSAEEAVARAVVTLARRLRASGQLNLFADPPGIADVVPRLREPLRALLDREAAATAQQEGER